MMRTQKIVCLKGAREYLADFSGGAIVEHLFTWTRKEDIVYGKVVHSTLCHGP